jgi:hypothetical protein
MGLLIARRGAVAATRPASEPDPGPPGDLSVAEVSTFAAGSSALSHDVTLPSDIVAGDVLVMWFRTATSPVDITTPSGWTALDSFGLGGTSTVMFRVADGNEGATVTVTLSATRFVSALVYQIKGAHGDVEADIEGSTTIDPPNLAPTWGSADNLWIALHSARRGNTYATAPPSGYGDMETISTAPGSADNGHCNVSGAHRILEASSENPGVFTTADDNNPHAATVAVRPA